MDRIIPDNEKFYIKCKMECCDRECWEAVCTEGLRKCYCKWSFNCRKEPAVWDLRAKLSGESGQCRGPRQEWAWPARDTEWIIDACPLHGDLGGHPGSSHHSRSGHGHYVYLQAVDSYKLYKWLFLSSVSACQNPGDGWLGEGPRNRLWSGLLIIPFPLKMDLSFSASSLGSPGAGFPWNGVSPILEGLAKHSAGTQLLQDHAPVTPTS